MHFLKLLSSLLGFAILASCLALDIDSMATSGPSPDGLYSPQEALDFSGYPVAPPELALEQVHVYVRHGTCLAMHSALRQC